jgi:RHS repeat-associated protein
MSRPSPRALVAIVLAANLSCDPSVAVRQQDERGHTPANYIGVEVGTLPGDLIALPSGDAAYSIPIAVPPGRSGLAPTLSFEYSSGRGNDWLGVGWTIGGISMIARCDRTHRVDGYLDPDPALAPFCLDGQRLHEVEKTNPEGLPEYRTRPDGFARITKLDPGWRVSSRDGLVHTYQDGVLRKTEDRHGNKVAYKGVLAGGRPRLLAVEYNFDKEGKNPLARIELHYEPRPDHIAGFNRSRAVAIDERLARVDVYWDDEIVRFYRLDYDDEWGMPSSTGRSRLQSVQTCWGDRDPDAPWEQILTLACIPPTRFKYQDGDVGFESGVEFDMFAPAHDHEESVVAFDLTGDGADDLALVRHDGVDWRWVYARSNPAEPGGFDAPVVTSIDPGTVRWLQVLDVNNDRSEDLVYQNGSAIRVLGGHPLGLFEAHVESVAPDTIEFLTSADINGDGFNDIITCERSDADGTLHWVWYEPPLDGTYELRRLATNEECHVGPKMVVDLDDNGAADVVELGDSYLHSDWLTEAPVTTGLPSGGSTSYSLGAPDINGDGYADPLEANVADVVDGVPTYNVYLRFGRGPVTTPSPYDSITSGDFWVLDDVEDDHFGFVRYLDWDADGTTEILVPHDGEWKVIDPTLIAEVEAGLVFEDGWGQGFQNTLTLELDEDVIETDIDFDGGAIVGDFDGDGLHDVVVNAGLGTSGPSARWTLYRHAKPRFRDVTSRGLPDLLREVENGYGEIQRVEYSPLADHVTYAATCSRSLKCDASARPVVTSLSVDDMRPSTYAYAGPRVDALGRRDLGFERVTITEDRGPAYDPIVTTHEYDNSTYDVERGDYLRAGVPRRTVTTVGGGLHTPADRLYERYVEPFVNETAEGSSYVVQAAFITEKVEEAGQLLVSRRSIFVYDDYGNVRAAMHEPGDGSTTLVNTTFGNDESAWLIGLADVQTITSSTAEGSAEQTTDFDWTSEGRLGRVVRSPNDNAYKRTLRYEYDDRGNLADLYESDNLGETRHTAIAWDDEAQVYPTLITNPLGHPRRLEWDVALGVVTREADAVGIGHRLEHDVFGRLLRSAVTDSFGAPSGEAVTIQYERRDPGSNMFPSRLRVRERVDGGAERWLEHDVHGRTERVSSYVSDDASFQEYTYDDLGRLIEVTEPAWLGFDPLFQWTFDFDNHDRIRFVHQPDGGSIQHAYDQLVTTTTDDEGRIYRRELDKLGRLVRSIDGYGTTSATRVCFAYGAFGLPVRAVRDCGAPSASTTTYTEYDPYGRRVGLRDPAIGDRSYAWDGFDQIELVTDGNGNEVEWDHDALGRITQRYERDTGAIHSWTWDVAYPGKLAEMRASNGTRENHTYDQFGRTRVVDTTIDHETFRRTIEYDAFGRPGRLTYPSPDDLPGFRVDMEYSNRGQLVAVRDPDEDTLFWGLDDVDASGRPTREVFGNGLVTERLFDPLGRPTSIQTKPPGDLDWLVGGAPNVRFWETYTWDGSGNLTVRTDEQHDQRDTLRYDGVNRLVRVTTRDLTTGQQAIATAGYDTYGNFTYRDAIDDYVTTPSGRVREAGDRGYLHDGNGNVTRVRSLIGGDSTLPIDVAWNGAGKPESITTPSSKYELDYDAAGALVRRDAPDETTIIVGPYERMTPASGPIEHRYRIHGPGGLVAQVTRTKEIGDLTHPTDDRDEPRARHEDEVVWIHADHLSSPRAFTDTTGKTVQALAYDPWGSPRAPADWIDGDPDANETSVDIDFGGHRPGGPFVDMGGRFFDPYAAAFLSPDPYVQAPALPTNYNRYAYTFQNPLSFTDPSGFNSVSTSYTPQANSGIAGLPIIGFLAAGLAIQNATAIADALHRFGQRVRDFFKGLGHGRGRSHDRDAIRIRLKSSTIAIAPQMSGTSGSNSVPVSAAPDDPGTLWGFVDRLTGAADAYTHHLIAHNIFTPWGWYNNGAALKSAVEGLIAGGPGGITDALISASGIEDLVEAGYGLRECESLGSAACGAAVGGVVEGVIGRKKGGKSIRKANYPSGYRKGVRDAAESKATDSNGVIRCQADSCGVALEKGKGTVEHVESVADHWNDRGHNQSRAERFDWYNDGANHGWFCSHCNSKGGAGKPRYNPWLGPGYSNDKQSTSAQPP